jgi:hypothetical protein
MIIALAGRRIDSPDADTPRFPEACRGPVRERLRELFGTLGATALVSSGACGADLLAMDVAGDLDMRRRMVLPFEPGRFRETSVEDRPGDWGPQFDRILAEVAEKGGVIVLEDAGESEAAFAAVNSAILDEAMRDAGAASAAPGRAGPADVAAVIVWEGAPRGPGDMTAGFAEEARGLGLRVLEVSTL